MRVVFGGISTLSLLIVLYAMVSLVFGSWGNEINFLKAITLILFAISLVVIFGSALLIDEVRNLNK